MISAYKKFIFILIFLIAGHAAWAGPAVSFPSVYQENGINLLLKESGYKRILLVRAFEAGFYFTDGAQDFLGNIPKRVEVLFFIHIAQKNLAGYVRGKIWDNVTQKEFNLLEERLKHMAGYLADIKPGDRYVLTYLPGEGTRFEYNGGLKGVIEGEDFAKGMFSIWVGKHPMDRAIKHQILEKFENKKCCAGHMF